MHEKQRCMIFFIFFNHFLCRFTSRLYKNIYCRKKKHNYPLTTTQGDRFAGCENIVSWSQTSSLPPPPHPAGHNGVQSTHKRVAIELTFLDVELLNVLKIKVEGTKLSFSQRQHNCVSKQILQLFDKFPHRTCNYKITKIVRAL